MHFRWWNSFNLLAVILLAVGIWGGIRGTSMVFDPGRAPSGKEWILYVVAGALMLVNGFLPSSSSPDDEQKNNSGKAAAAAAAPPAPPATETKSSTDTTPAPAASE